jgi:hypothetical protein
MWAYTVHGWGHGLLLLDRVEDFLIMFYALAAHVYTRGTWTAAEISTLDRSSASSGYCVPSQTLVPLYLKWMLVWEDPVERVLWLGKALPRDWLEHSLSSNQWDGDEKGEVSGQKGEVVVNRATTRYGRLSFTLLRESVTTLHANITLLPPPFAATSTLLPSFPPGGLKLRVRVPMNTVLMATSAGMLNATEQTVSFDHATWATRAAAEPGMAQVQSVVVTLRRTGGGSLKTDDSGLVWGGRLSLRRYQSKCSHSPWQTLPIDKNTNTKRQSLATTAVTCTNISDCTDDIQTALSDASTAHVIIISDNGHVWNGGTAPRAGVDLEPNGAANVLLNVTLRNVYVSNNTDAFDISANTAHSITLDGVHATRSGSRWDRGWGSAFSLNTCPVWALS